MTYMITFKRLWLCTQLCACTCMQIIIMIITNILLIISALDGTAISVFGDTMISTGPVLAHCDQSTKQIHPTSQLQLYIVTKFMITNLLFTCKLYLLVIGLLNQLLMQQNKSDACSSKTCFLLHKGKTCQQGKGMVMAKFVSKYNIHVL